VNLTIPPSDIPHPEETNEEPTIFTQEIAKLALDSLIVNVANSPNFKLPPRRYDYTRGRSFDDPTITTVGASFRYPGLNWDAITFEIHLSSALYRIATFKTTSQIPEQAVTILTIPALTMFGEKSQPEETVDQALAFTIKWIENNPKVKMPSLRKETKKC
jgi:hypothetical protein